MSADTCIYGSTHNLVSIIIKRYVTYLILLLRQPEVNQIDYVLFRFVPTCHYICRFQISMYIVELMYTL